VLYMCQIRQYDMHVYIYMYVYIYTHTHKHIHTRTHTLSLAEVATSFHTTDSYHPKKLHFSMANASSHNFNRSHEEREHEGESAREQESERARERESERAREPERVPE